MKKTLVIMAAGMGSRFGGLKQITPVDEEGNFLLDYSIYDAKKAGFSKVVFVIKEENLEDFKSTVGKRIEGKIEVEYVFQKLEDIPVSMDISSRVKPWGTVQAVLCAKDVVDDSFVILNADDFYGRDAFVGASQFLEQNIPYTYASLSYPFGVTESLEGAVKRGVLKLDHECVKDIIECSIERQENHTLLASPLDGSESFEIFEDTPVSMNLFAFSHDFFDFLEEYWVDYFKKDKEYILSHEALLPDCLKENLEKGKIKILHKPSHSKWIGMTYKSDLENVKNELKKMKEEGIYPEKLWEE